MWPWHIVLPCFAAWWVWLCHLKQDGSNSTPVPVITRGSFYQATSPLCRENSQGLRRDVCTGMLWPRGLKCRDPLNITSYYHEFGFSRFAESRASGYRRLTVPSRETDCAAESADSRRQPVLGFNQFETGHFNQQYSTCAMNHERVPFARQFFIYVRAGLRVPVVSDQVSAEAPNARRATPDIVRLRGKARD